MLKEAVPPPSIMPSTYGPDPHRRRAADIPGIVSLEIRELFPDVAQAIYSQGCDLAVIRRATEDALASVNMGMIRTQDTVNILCSEHGFVILGGEPYAEMLRTIKDVVEQRTGCKNIRLRLAAGDSLKEAKELIQYYKLGQYFNGRAMGISSVEDKGVPIETEIGRLYGVARVYDADWFIHAHYGDLRELYWHRLINRALKPFVMSYARLETRGVYHFNFGPRSSNFIQKAIFDSPFVQQKFAFGCFLITSPMGIIGIDADNNLYQIDRRLTVTSLKAYGKLLRLFAKIEECIVVLDAGRWPAYVHAGGMTFGNLVNGQLDFFDLETVPAGTGFAMFERAPGTPKIRPVNPSIKALVINYIYTGTMYTELPMNIPTVVVGRDLADMLITDSANPEFMNYAMTAESLEAAVMFARRIAKTDNIIVFDGSFGSINLSPSMAEFLVKKGPEVSRNVDEELLPKWLRQRGIDPQRS
jgi:hypothetical protein